MTIASSSISRPRTPRDVGTIAWKLQREIILLLAWAPAILLQLAHPLVAQGVADHSTFRLASWGRVGRFQRTLEAMLRLSFGTEAEARLVIARINAIHDNVQGRLREVAGVFPAGTRYSAHDPSLLAWVHATLVDMNLRVYELFVDCPSVEEKDRYCARPARSKSALASRKDGCHEPSVRCASTWTRCSRAAKSRSPASRVSWLETYSIRQRSSPFGLRSGGHAWPPLAFCHRRSARVTVCR